MDLPGVAAEFRVIENHDAVKGFSDSLSRVARIADNDAAAGSIISRSSIRSAGLARAKSLTRAAPPPSAIVAPSNSPLM